jgi:predicted RND superfamily exporter protein
VRYALIPLSCVTLCLVWTFGLVSILQVPLSILTMIVPVFLIAVGTAYCLHILAEYRATATSSLTLSMQPQSPSPRRPCRPFWPS